MFEVFFGDVYELNGGVDVIYAIKIGLHIVTRSIYFEFFFFAVKQLVAKENACVVEAGVGIYDFAGEGFDGGIDRVDAEIIAIEAVVLVAGAKEFEDIIIIGRWRICETDGDSILCAATTIDTCLRCVDDAGYGYCCGCCGAGSNRGIRRSTDLYGVLLTSLDGGGARVADAAIESEVFGKNIVDQQPDGGICNEEGRRKAFILDRSCVAYIDLKLLVGFGKAADGEQAAVGW